MFYEYCISIVVALIIGIAIGVIIKSHKILPDTEYYFLIGLSILFFLLNIYAYLDIDKSKNKKKGLIYYETPFHVNHTNDEANEMANIEDKKRDTGGAI